MTVPPLREVERPGEIDGASFATLKRDDCQLTLQTLANHADELPPVRFRLRPEPSGTVYFQGRHCDTARHRIAPADEAKGSPNQ